MLAITLFIRNTLDNLGVLGTKGTPNLGGLHPPATASLSQKCRGRQALSPANPCIREAVVP